MTYFFPLFRNGSPKHFIQHLILHSFCQSLELVVAPLAENMAHPSANLLLKRVNSTDFIISRNNSLCTKSQQKKLCLLFCRCCSVNSSQAALLSPRTPRFGLKSAKLCYYPPPLAWNAPTDSVTSQRCRSSHHIWQEGEKNCSAKGYVRVDWRTYKSDVLGKKKGRLHVNICTNTMTKLKSCHVASESSNL